MSDWSLEPNDVCDRCGVQARAKTMHDVDDHRTALLWCGHHFREHKNKLIPHLVFLLDDDGKDRTKEAQRA